MFILDRPDQRKQIIDTKVKLLVDTFIKNQNFKGDILEKLVLALGSEQTSAPIVVVDTLLVPSPTTRITTSSPKITLFRARNLAVVAVDRLPADVPVWFSLFKQQWGNSLTLYLFITMCFYCDHCGFFSVLPQRTPDEKQLTTVQLEMEKILPTVSCFTQDAQRQTNVH